MKNRKFWEPLLKSLSLFSGNFMNTRIQPSHDEEADVLYLNFKNPNRADDSELLDNDVLVRYEGEEVVGMTVMNASKRRK
ncbi:MAG: DUF2283 domain-containing protein [Anaerolineales bacterium]|nr:DUF2283 domain-containing protein [Anaerolineales bacterium]